MAHGSLPLATAPLKASGKRRQDLPNELTRRFEGLVSYLFLEDDFPDGVVLCTGTALVPERPFTLQPGDIVQITID